MIKPTAQAIVCAVLAGLLGMPAFAATKLDEGIAAYNARNYRAAIPKLQQFLASHPNDTKAHYYLGLALQATSQLSLAKGHYMWIYENGTDARLKYNAWQALSHLGKVRASSGNSATALTSGNSQSSMGMITSEYSSGSSSTVREAAPARPGVNVQVDPDDPTGGHRSNNGRSIISKEDDVHHTIQVTKTGGCH